jgi:hypothetical protein
MQTRAKWSRWGWGACEGYGLEIGETFRCSVVLKPGTGPSEPPSFTASINSNILGRHSDMEAAMRAVEKELACRMAQVQHDWTYDIRSQKARRSASPRGSATAAAGSRG